MILLVSQFILFYFTHFHFVFLILLGSHGENKYLVSIFFFFRNKNVKVKMCSSINLSPEGMEQEGNISTGVVSWAGAAIKCHDAEKNKRMQRHRRGHMYSLHILAGHKAHGGRWLLSLSRCLLWKQDHGMRMSDGFLGITKWTTKSSNQEKKKTTSMTLMIVELAVVWLVDWIIFSLICAFAGGKGIWQRWKLCSQHNLFEIRYILFVVCLHL